MTIATTCLAVAAFAVQVAQAAASANGSDALSTASGRPAASLPSISYEQARRRAGH